MSIVIFSDIDDTLIQTERKSPQGAELTVTAVDKEDQPASFSTLPQMHLFNWYANQQLIPVTGRNKDALDRVSLQFTSYKVIDHGAIVLDEQDEIDSNWLDILNRESGDWQKILDNYVDEVTNKINDQQLSLRCRVINDFGFPCYISIKGEPDDLKKLAGVAERFCQLSDNARQHINGNNMALLPPYACKKRAVEFLQQQFLSENNGTLFVGAGDSSSDLAFMQSCHFQMIPLISQISRNNLS
jgi:hypothetical protein